ncbi:MAG: RidA family protein [Ruminococcaceae bacterium]|nr:RidA family protein [Oscillospiraceae bacterium]
MKEPIFAPDLPRPKPPYSPAVRLPAGSHVVFASGQLGMDPVSGELAKGIEAQTEQALRNLAAILEAAGASLATVVKANVYLKDMNDFERMNEVYGRVFPQPYPARTAVEVARLPRDAMIEIEAVALTEE